MVRDAKDVMENHVPSGMVFKRFDAGEWVFFKNMVMVRLRSYIGSFTV
jgi:hypothetical protein